MDLQNIYFEVTYEIFNFTQTCYIYIYITAIRNNT
jgi:hypothetical protein